MYEHSDISTVKKFIVENPQLRLVEFYLNGMVYDNSPKAKNSTDLMHKLIKIMKYKNCFLNEYRINYGIFFF